ncbi:MAG: AAA family ATPase [Archangiaceae bacterium]|nr:AAA family ATPase [Archangiaceae bacterium]
MLSQVRAVAMAQRPEPGADPVQVRLRLFEALRRLLANLALKGPLVLVLEDLQWAGGDTWALLSHLFRAQPSPEMLVVFTVRVDERGVDEVLQRRVAELAALSVKWVGLPPLRGDESRALARHLLERLQAPAAWLEQIVADASGNPLLIDAMARGGLLPSTRSLDELLLYRVEALDPATRRILELVCLSNAPLVQQAVATAAGLDLKTFNTRVGVLKAARLVRTTGVRALDTIDAFQDRLRVAVTGALSAETRTTLHQAVASALQGSAVPDHEAMAYHWARAGHAERAAAHAERAADHAMERLAFERAARLYGDALAVRPAQVSLHERLGEALVGAGRGAEAGAVFDRAAELSDPVQALELTRRAAHEFMRSGHIDQGLLRLAEVLSSVGERLIESPLGALVSLLIGRAILWVRGLKFTERTIKQVPAAELLRIDATWAASEALAPVDVVRGAYLQARHTILCLRAGEPQRIARALAVEAVLVGSEGSARYVEAKALYARAVEAAARASERGSHGYLIGIEGIIEFHAGLLPAAHQRLAQAIKKLQLEGRGMRFELANARLFLLVTQFYLGNLKQLFAAVPELIHESERLGDRFALTSYRLNHCNTYWLARDDVRGAAAQVTGALSGWSPRGYQTLHYYALLASVQLALYTGDGRAAHARVRAEWQRLERSFLLRVQALRIEALHLRGRAAWAACDERDARRCLKQLQAERHPLAGGLAAALEVAMAPPSGGDALWSGAERLLAEQHLELLLQAVRFRRWEGREEQAAPRQWFVEQGVVNPEAFVAMLLPSRGASGG